MKHRVTLIPGDGIGPEVAQAMKRVVTATGVVMEWEEVSCGSVAMEKYGTPLPDQVLDSVRRNRVAIKGPIMTPIGTGFRSVNVALRQKLDLYACVRPCKWYLGVRSRYRDIDLIIIRENTEDLYAGIEFSPGSAEVKTIIELVQRTKKKTLSSDTAISLKPISKKASERIVRFAFEYALGHRRKKVTAVHKANIMKVSDGLFLETAREVAREYQGRVEFEDRIVDNMSMQLVQSPELYDCLVLPNLYGDILSDLCAGLIGGLGIAPGANIGDQCVLFEPTHGAAPKYTGQNKANPTAMILSAVLMLEHLREEEAARRLESAVAQVIREGKQVTYDLKADRNDPSAVGTQQMADAIIEKLT